MRLPKLHVEKTKLKEFIEKAKKDFGFIESKIENLTLVKDLTETSALTGFSRVLSSTKIENLQSTFHPDKKENWMLARQSRGEGIFIELNQEAIEEWESREEVIERAEALREKFLEDEFLRKKIHFTSPRHILVHSLAHILINELVYESGYGSASLRERLYVSDEQETKMTAFMIYTAAGDTSGSLGGLVRLGEPHRFLTLLKSALIRSRWCSYDPICCTSYKANSKNNASCLSCSFISETSCECGNMALDRVFLGAIADPISIKTSFFDF